MWMEGALLFQLHHQYRVDEMKRQKKLQFSGISAIGKLLCLCSFASDQYASPRQHCSQCIEIMQLLWKKNEEISCYDLENKNLCKWKKRKEKSGLCSHLSTPTAHQLWFICTSTQHTICLRDLPSTFWRASWNDNQAAKPDTSLGHVMLMKQSQDLPHLIWIHRGKIIFPSWSGELKPIFTFTDYLSNRVDYHELGRWPLSFLKSKTRF